MKKWEYKNAYVDLEDNFTWLDKANELGSQGWELIITEQWPCGQLLIFKREVTDGNQTAMP